MRYNCEKMLNPWEHVAQHYPVLYICYLSKTKYLVWFGVGR